MLVGRGPSLDLGRAEALPYVLDAACDENSARTRFFVELILSGGHGFRFRQESAVLEPRAAGSPAAARAGIIAS